MKKFTIILALALYSLSVLSLSLDEYGLTLGGAYTGFKKLENESLNFSGVNYKDQFSFPLLGIYANGDLMKFVSYNIGLYYSPRGGYYNVGYGYPHIGKRTDKLHYLSMPFDLELFPEKKLALKAGFGLSYLFNKRLYVGVPGTEIKYFEASYRFGFQIKILKAKLDIIAENSLLPWRIEKRSNTTNFYRNYYNRGIQATIHLPISIFNKDE